MNSLKSNTSTPKSLFIVGPTAGGKSKLALRIAQQCNGEIICADSQTVRKHFDVLSAKPSVNEQELITHYMLDLIEPYERYSASQFKDEAEKCINSINRKGKLPIIVGGAGLYIDSLLYNFPFRKSTNNIQRSDLEKMTISKLQELAGARGLELPKNKQNSRHLIRTIETNGEVSKSGTLLKNTIVVGIDPGKTELENQITQRVNNIIKQGVIQEIEEALAKYGRKSESIDIIGVKIALKHRDSSGEYDIESIKSELITAHKQYAKRQRAWFKRSKDIVWFEQPTKALEYLKKLL